MGFLPILNALVIVRYNDSLYLIWHIELSSFFMLKFLEFYRPIAANFPRQLKKVISAG